MPDVSNPEADLPDASETPHLTLSFEDPFATPQELRRSDRRFRGRLVAPVTVWTAGSGDRRAGLTVSSLLLAEGDPAEVIGLLDPLSDVFDVIAESASFVVHILNAEDRRLAEMFAGAYPVDPFEEVEADDGEFGPVLVGMRSVLGCRLVASEEVGFQALVRGRIEAIQLAADGGRPLVRYRGRYRKLQAET